MKRIAAVISTAFFISLSSCDSEDTETYEFTGEWLFSSAQNICSQPLPAAQGSGDIEFSAIRVKVYQKEKDKNPIKTELFDCKDGSFTIDDLKRGSYFVKVEAMAEDPTDEITSDADAGTQEVETPEPETRAYYVGTGTVVVPSSDDRPVGFEMNIGKGSVEVSWGFENGGCSSEWNDVEKVKVELTGESEINNRESGRIDCDVTGQSYLFDDLSWDVYSVTVTGYNSKNEETHRGGFDAPIEVRPGTEISGLDGLVELDRIE